MRKSHLFGTLEAPGQKAYPSKDFKFNDFNPKQPVQKEGNVVLPRLSNGRVWTHSGEMPLSRCDVYPKLNPEKTWRHLSQGTGAFGADFRASNPETITSFGIMPSYPEEEAMRAALMSRPKVMAEKVEQREVFPKAEKPEMALPKIGSKFTPAKLEQLAKLGIPEELIGKAIEEELKKDMMAFINNPALLADVQTTEAIQQIYEKYVTKQKALKTGENAPGDAPGAASQNVGVRAYSFAAQMSMLSPKQQRLAKMRAEEMGFPEESILPEEEHQEGFASLLRGAMGPVNMLEMGAGAGGTGLSVGPFSMLLGTRVAAAEKAQAQEAAEEERYGRTHSLMEAAAAPAAAQRILRRIARGPKGELRVTEVEETQYTRGMRKLKTGRELQRTKAALEEEGKPVFKLSARPGRPRKSDM